MQFGKQSADVGVSLAAAELGELAGRDHPTVRENREPPGDLHRLPRVVVM